MNTATQARVAQLEQVFTHIGATRMHGVPVLNKALRVQAVGFALLADEAAPVLLGILVTPWFMNLLRLPLATQVAVAAPGSKHGHACGNKRFEFIAAEEEALGAFETCSLFSPMFEFADQAGALATAHEILKLLRTPPAAAPATTERATPSASTALRPAATSASQDASLAVPSRRGFLLGRVRPGAAP